MASSYCVGQHRCRSFLLSQSSFDLCGCDIVDSVFGVMCCGIDAETLQNGHSSPLPYVVRWEKDVKLLLRFLQVKCCELTGSFFLPTVLESWLDYTGELEPPEPLARLPQLKHCIKQLLMDLGKVQQIALCCST